MITVEMSRSKAVRRYSVFLWRKKSQRAWRIRDQVVLDVVDFWNFNILYQKYSLSFVIIITAHRKMPSIISQSMNLLSFLFPFCFYLIISYHLGLGFWVAHSFSLFFLIMLLFYSQNFIDLLLLTFASFLRKNKAPIMQCQ